VEVGSLHCVPLRSAPLNVDRARPSPPAAPRCRFTAMFRSPHLPSGPFEREVAKRKHTHRNVAHDEHRRGDGGRACCRRSSVLAASDNTCIPFVAPWITARAWTECGFRRRRAILERPPWRRCPHLRTVCGADDVNVSLPLREQADPARGGDEDRRECGEHRELHAVALRAQADESVCEHVEEDACDECDGECGHHLEAET
jgi:hypothetical protein